jgi:hypothetical protein
MIILVRGEVDLIDQHPHVREKERIMNQEKIKNKLPLFDIYQIAYAEMQGVIPELSIQGTRVAFNLPASDEVYKILREYQTNPSVSILDYVKVLRRLRAKMLSMRGQG